MLVEVTLALSAVAAALLCYLSRHFSYWRRMGIPSDRALPFFGSRKDMFLMRSHECVDTDRIYRQFPDAPYAGFFEGDQPVLLVRDPALVRRLFASEADMPLSRRLHQDEDNPFTQTLFFAHGECWKKMRALLRPGFTTARLRRAVRIFDRNIAEAKRTLIPDGAVVEVGDVAGRYAMDNMTSWVFGMDLSSVRDPGNEFRRLVLTILGPGTATQLKRLMAWFFRSLLALLPVNYSFPGREISQFMNKTVEELVQSHGDRHGDDLLRCLTKLRGHEILPVNEARTKPLIMTDELVSANAFMVLLGGTDTSSSTITFCLLELALNHEIQNRLYEEIESKAPRCQQHDDTAEGFTYEALKEMKYLDMVISETLRKWPSAVAVGRVAVAKTFYPGTKVVLQPGMGILIPIWSFHRDEKFYPEPEKFDPERFTEEAKAQREPGTYLPFGEGGHTCIGMHLALLQVKVGVASIVRDYVVETSGKTKTSVKLDPTAFINAQEGGTWLKFVSRSSYEVNGRDNRHNNKQY